MKYFYPNSFQFRFVLILNLILDKILSHYNDETAIVFSDEKISYRLLIDEAFNVYSFLKSKNITSDWVAISTNEGWKSYACIIGVWMLGKGYLPVNVDAPEDRNNEILKSAGCNFVLEKDYYTNIGLYYNQEVFSEVNGLAYLLFTSGTTGKPKGVPISIKNLSSFTAHYENHNVIQFTRSDVFLQSYELTFDVSIFCYTMAFMNGAKLVLPEQTQVKYQGLFKAIKAYDVTVVSFVPSVVRMSFQFLNRLKLPSVKFSFFSGEALNGDWAEAWMDCVSSAKVYNCYGPTETVIVCTEEALFELDKSYFKTGIPLPLGTSFKGVDITITDGEICFSGDQVFNGYLNSESLSNYHSGDMAQFDDNGKLIFKGRKDDQIQWNGYRIQLSEIDAVLNDKLNSWCKAIYYDEKLIVFTLSDLELVKVTIQECFPLHYVPSRIVCLDEVPLNSNGKLNVTFLKGLFH
jgi:acyl-coenzyme A synthetase/AMP-(fatty) acid ligase